MKKTVVIIHPHFTIPGGAGKVILEIGKRLAKSVNVLCVAQKINDVYVNDYKGINFHSLDGPTTNSFSFWLLFPYWQYKTWKTVNGYISAETTILCSVFPSNWIIFPYKLFHPKVKIIWFCQEPSAFVQDTNWINAISNPVKRVLAKLFNPIFKVVDQNLAKIPNYILANSYYAKELIKKVYKRDSIVVYPGIDKKRFYPIPFSKKEDYILTVSRLSKFKNIDILIKAYSKLINSRFRLKIVGNGEELNNLMKLCRKLEISHRVDFLTKVSDSEIVKIYQKAKLFVLCSKNEPFGIVPVEAMACGTPVIADESGGPKETIINGKTGLLIKNIDPRNLCHAIESVEGNLKDFSSNCSNYLSDKFDWKVDKILTLLNSNSKFAK